MTLIECLENSKIIQNRKYSVSSFTLSTCIPPAFPTLTTKIKDTALGRYSIIFFATSFDPPIPGVSTKIVLPCKIKKRRYVKNLENYFLPLPYLQTKNKEDIFECSNL